MTGTMWHEWIEHALKRLGLPYMAEVNVTPWLPKGWGGTADIVLWSPEHQGFVLVDLKTSKGESIRWKVERGASDEHQWQTSLYWHALKKMGLPMVKQIGVFYLPKNDTRKKDENVVPFLAEFEPITQRTLAIAANKRREKVESYVGSLKIERDHPDVPLGEWLTDELAPVQDRVQRIYRDRASGTNKLKLIPHWSTQFCPFPTELCDCREHRTVTIGHFEDDDYYPKKGWEDVEPEVFPEEG